MSIGECDLSMERECDENVLIKQICAGSDVMSQCVCSMSFWCDRSVAAQDGTLHETPEVIDEAELKNVRRNRTAMQGHISCQVPIRRYRHIGRDERE